MKKKIRFMLLAAIMCCAASCIRYKQLANFSEGAELQSGLIETVSAPYLIQAHDPLRIVISVGDADQSNPFALAGQLQGVTAAGQFLHPTHTVDAEGRIQLPLIGSVRVAGLDVNAASDTLSRRIQMYFVNPVVSIRVTHFRYTLLGEVRTPGTFTSNRERISILEALGLAGDLTNYADRRRILVVRESAGERRFAYIDLHARDVFKSPYYYLQPGDVVYVEPLRAKVGSVSDQANKVLPYLSLSAVLLNLLIILGRP
ncbi:MAG: polysaccharide biosynthesis/export family protein [Saprospiraceae bacterium]